MVTQRLCDWLSFAPRHDGSLYSLSNFPLVGFWGYLIIFVIGPIVWIIWNWRFQPHMAYYLANPADDLEELSNEQRCRLNAHFNREKRVWDFWRQQIDLFYTIQFYVSVITVIAPVFLAALSPIAKSQHVELLLSVISIHLAITYGLYKTLKVERVVQKGVDLENYFYALFWSFLDEIRITPTDERIAKYLAEYAKIRRKAFSEESSTLPSPREHTP